MALSVISRNRRFAGFLVVLVLACVPGRLALACDGGGCGVNSEVHARNSGNTGKKKTVGTVLVSPTAIKWKYDQYMTGPPVTVHPERTIWIKISSTDINRIVCTSGTITDVNYSQEKGVQVKINGKEAFLKLQAVLDQSGQPKYSTIPVDLYVTCDGDTYGFIGRPLKIPSKTIYLVNPKKKIKETVSNFKSSDIDQAVQGILEQVFMDRIPPSWLEEKSRNVTPPAGLEMKPIKSWRIPGVGIVVRLFSVKALQMARISEKILLFEGVTINPVAISIEKHHLKFGETTRAVILEKVNAQ